jgi:hypothetical protein
MTWSAGDLPLLQPSLLLHLCQASPHLNPKNECDDAKQHDRSQDFQCKVTGKENFGADTLSQARRAIFVTLSQNPTAG